jgi:hypothetical protein
MDAMTFETKLRADGFVEIERKRLDARPANGEHGHHWNTRGLILDGVFTITRGDTARSYRAGETFEVAADELHFEEVGSGGVELMVGRKY